MNSLTSVVQQRQKEQRALRLFLASSLAGSLVFHIGAMSLQVKNWWDVNLQPDETDETELVVEDLAPEEPTLKEPIAEVPPPDVDLPQAVAFVPEEPAFVLEEPLSPVVPAAPVLKSVGEDAPTKEPPATTGDPVAPLASASGDTAVPQLRTGSITSPTGTGRGFGNAEQSTGLVPRGLPEGNPGDKPVQTATSTIPLPPPVQPSRSQEPVCISCPKPAYPGTEASPRVELRIRPDGTVDVRLRRSSGNPEVDRATLETMRQWRFDPQTVPPEGVSRRVRVTYEEEGSAFQRENERRRRLEAEQRAAEQRRREEAPRQQPLSTTPSAPVTSPSAPVTSPAKPAPVTSPAKPASATTTPASVSAPTAVPNHSAPAAPAPAEALPPAPVEVLPPPPPEPAPVAAPPPAPVEAPPPPVEAASPPATAPAPASSGS
ncbi:MAG: TonB family protein [Cyanobacteria bacterium]|nr:TonB family protein [Cyanobacteriota bacterium]MDW8201370.1 TonB family protein [Cyanobacteriota bacterium SKYGB_h_bin112]